MILLLTSLVKKSLHHNLQLKEQHPLRKLEHKKIIFFQFVFLKINNSIYRKNFYPQLERLFLSCSHFWGFSWIYCLVFCNYSSFLIITSKNDLCQANTKSSLKLWIFLDENVLNHRIISDNQWFFIAPSSVVFTSSFVGTGLKPVPTGAFSINKIQWKWLGIKIIEIISLWKI